MCKYDVLEKIIDNPQDGTCRLQRSILACEHKPWFFAQHMAHNQLISPTDREAYNTIVYGRNPVTVNARRQCNKLGFVLRLRICMLTQRNTPRVIFLQIQMKLSSQI